jgi:hypothetical protein
MGVDGWFISPHLIPSPLRKEDIKKMEVFFALREK